MHPSSCLLFQDCNDGMSVGDQSAYELLAGLRRGVPEPGTTSDVGEGLRLAPGFLERVSMRRARSGQTVESATLPFWTS